MKNITYPRLRLVYSPCIVIIVIVVVVFTQEHFMD